jgi:hypothetical protein
LEALMTSSAAVWPGKRGLIPRFFRNSENGDSDMRFFPRYLSESNNAVVIQREPVCHTRPEFIENAREFVRELGGVIVFTVIPSLHYCEMQAREIAAAVGPDVAISGRIDYTSWDGGGHLDARGAAQFTEDLIAALAKTAAFKRSVRAAH